MSHATYQRVDESGLVETPIRRTAAYVEMQETPATELSGLRWGASPADDEDVMDAYVSRGLRRFREHALSAGDGSEDADVTGPSSTRSQPD